MSDAGYYKSNPRAMSLREMARMRGWLRLPLTYSVARFAAPIPEGWMPQTWAELECTEAELSPQCLKVAEPYREMFCSLGFGEVGFKKGRRLLNPHHRDNGGINFLDRGRRYFGQLIYAKFHAPPPVRRDREQMVIGFTAVFEKKVLSCSNNTKTAFDAVPWHQTVRIASNDVAGIYRHFVDAVVRHKEKPRQFEDLQALQNWFDQDVERVFEHRLRRKLYLRMNDEEVVSARRKLPPLLPKA
ncbi:MAG TPA: hypothetical protein VL527_06570 [Dongiaceae bacterium]|nr:hypothetical protein [Dongiaceae bacterium]